MEIAKSKLKQIIEEEIKTIQKEAWWPFGKKKKAAAAAPAPAGPTAPEEPQWDTLAASKMKEQIKEDAYYLARVLDKSYDLIMGGSCRQGETSKCKGLFDDWGETFWRMLKMGKAGGWSKAGGLIMANFADEMEQAMDNHNMKPLERIAKQIQAWLAQAADIANDSEARDRVRDSEQRVKDFQAMVARNKGGVDHLLSRHENKKLTRSRLQIIIKEEIAKIKH